MRWLRWLLDVLTFVPWFLGELLVSNAVVLRTILRGGTDTTPIIAECHTRCRSDVAISLLAVLWTLTPGTLVIATVKRRSTGEWDMSVHDMYAGTPEVARAHVRRLEDRMLRILPPPRKAKEEG